MSRITFENLLRIIENILKVILKLIDVLQGDSDENLSE